MLIEQPPLFYRILFPETVWRLHRKRRTVFLTFDDGPIPEVTPWVLDTLDHYGVKATFFLVGDNVRRHPELLEECWKSHYESLAEHQGHNAHLSAQCGTCRPVDRLPAVSSAPWTDALGHSKAAEESFHADNV